MEALGLNTRGSEAHTDGAIQEHMAPQDSVSKPGLTTLAFLDAGRDSTQLLGARKVCGRWRAAEGDREFHSTCS